MQCSLEFFNAWCCRLSHLYTPLLQQHIAFVSGISQPCNSFSELHALFTTCRMCCTNRGTQSVKQGRHPKCFMHYASKYVPRFSCVCMMAAVINVTYCAGGSNRLQQVYCTMQPSWFWLRSCAVHTVHRSRSEAASTRMPVLLCLLAVTGSTVFSSERSKRKIAWLAHLIIVISLILWYLKLQLLRLPHGSHQVSCSTIMLHTLF